MEKEIESSLTVLVVTYNRIGMLRDCLKSLEIQTCLDYNLLIINNGSTDDTSKFLSNFPKFNIGTLHIGSIPLNNGPADAFEFARKRVNSDWLTIVCDDDLLHPDFVSQFYHVRNTYNIHDKCVIVDYSDFEVVSDIVFSEEELQPYICLDVKSSMILYKSGKLSRAGISGFFFSAIHYCSYFPFRFANGFMEDDLLLLMSLSESGVVRINRKLYWKRVHKNAESVIGSYGIDYLIASHQFYSFLKTIKKSNNIRYKNLESLSLSLLNYFKLFHVVFRNINYPGIYFKNYLKYLYKNDKIYTFYIPVLISFFIIFRLGRFLKR